MRIVIPIPLMALAACSSPNLTGGGEVVLSLQQQRDIVERCAVAASVPGDYTLMSDGEVLRFEVNGSVTPEIAALANTCIDAERIQFISG